MPSRQSKTPRLRPRKLASQDISTSPIKESTRGTRSPKTPGWVSGSKAVFRTPSLSPLSPPKGRNTRRSSVFTKSVEKKVPQLAIKADIHANRDGRKLAVFKVPKPTSPPAKSNVQTSNRRTSVYKKTNLKSFNISLSPRTANLISPPGVKTRARRSSVYQKISVNLVDINENIDSPIKGKTKEIKKIPGKTAKKASPGVQPIKSPVMRRSQKRKIADSDSPAQVKRAKTNGGSTVTKLKEEKVIEEQETKSRKAKTPGRQSKIIVQSKAISPTSVEKEKSSAAVLAKTSQKQTPVKTPKKQTVTVTPASSSKVKRKVNQGNSTPRSVSPKKQHKTNMVKTPTTKKATPVSKTSQKIVQVSTPKPIVRPSVTKTKTPTRAAEKLGFEKEIISPIITVKNTSNKRKTVKVKSPPSSSGKRLKTPKTLPKTPVPRRKLTPARITETRDIRQKISRKIVESPVSQPQDETDIHSVSMNTSAMNDSLLSTSGGSLNATYSHSTRCIIL